MPRPLSTPQARETALLEARSLYHAGQADKREANRLRRQAASKMARFAQFKQKLEALGVEVVIEPSTPPDHLVRGGPSDRHRNTA